MKKHGMRLVQPVSQFSPCELKKVKARYRKLGYDDVDVDLTANPAYVAQWCRICG